MAIRLIDKYPSRVDPVSPDYPHGAPRNESTPGANNGTPLEQDWLRDYEGFFQALLAEGGITPSGTPDTALASDRLNALKRIARDGAQVSTLTALQSLPPGQRRGAVFVIESRTMAIWRSGDQSTNVSAAPNLWIAPLDAPTGASGAWELMRRVPDRQRFRRHISNDYQ